MLLGGFTTNFLWCAYLIRRNGSVGELVGRPGPAVDADGQPPPLFNNYVLAAFGGTLWYFQFFFYTMGESQMGRYSFSSWTLHVASIILFSTLWGFALKEWGARARVRARWFGLVSARWSARPSSSESATRWRSDTRATGQDEALQAA